MKYFSLLFFLFSSFGAHSQSIDSIKKNSEGVKALQEERPQKAYQSFLSALVDNPYNPVVKNNLGIYYEANKEPLKAEKEYAGVVRYSGENEELKFVGLFNQARMHSNKNVDLALDLYQKALAIKPDSKEVKTNIELLMKNQDQQQGGGEGNKDQDKKDKDQKDDQEGKGKDKDKDKKSPPPPKPKKQKKKFKSKSLSKNDVRKILEELKNQEKKIREKEFGKQSKENSFDKDW